MYHLKSKNNFILKILSVLLMVLILTSFPQFKAYASDSTVNQARNIIKQYYINEIPDDILNSASTVEELVDDLNDPHSAYFTSTEYQNFVGGINNKFSGIGISMDIVSEGVKVISVMEGSPAFKAGISEGDIIVSSDAHSLSGISLEQAAAYIKGIKGTCVNLTVKRKESFLYFSVIRDDIIMPTVDGKMLNNNIAYIRISSFGKDTPSEFGSKLNEFDKNNAEGYIIDLRFNPGGYLDSAVNIAGYFEAGKPAMIVKDKNSQQDTYFSPANLKKIDKPVIFLINEYSASASEILSSFVKDYKTAFIIGKKSYGKGTVQNIFPLNDGSYLKITILKFYSPFGNVIDKQGILPDIDMDDEDSIAAASLLLAKSGDGQDKRGFVKLNIKDRNFEIDMSRARKPEYWKAYKKILDYAEKSGKVYLGNVLGWAKVSNDDYLSLYYPEYNILSALKDIPVNKKFTVKFSSALDICKINGDNIELINALNGERTSIRSENIDETTIMVTPDNNLNSGGLYYLVIHNNIKGKNGTKMNTGAVVEISVK